MGKENLADFCFLLRGIETSIPRRHTTNYRRASPQQAALAPKAQAPDTAKLDQPQRRQGAEEELSTAITGQGINGVFITGENVFVVFGPLLGLVEGTPVGYSDE